MSLMRRKLCISIHAPTRGATSHFWILEALWVISIHAPTRGATPGAQTVSALHLFQSTLLQEERRGLFNNWVGILLFQSTLLQEERLRLGSGAYRSCYFNPRSYKRSDPGVIFSTCPVFLISIHAPTRGATVYG